MAKYKAPGIAVHQIVQPNATPSVPDQNVAIVGPNATLRLYNTSASEQAQSYAGEYNTGTAGVFNWVRGIGDEDVDLDFTKVYLKNALLKLGSVPLNDLLADAAVLPDRYNQLMMSDTNLFGDGRGIKIGDVIGVIIGGTEYFSPIRNIEPFSMSLPVDDTMTAVSNESTAEITVEGTFSGADAATYILEVKQGGTFAGPDKPIVRVRTTTGSDTVNEIKVSLNTPYNLGTSGLTFTVTAGTGLTQGESFHYTVATENGINFNLVTLAQNLPLQSNILNVAYNIYAVRDYKLSAVYYTQDQDKLTKRNLTFTKL